MSNSYVEALRRYQDDGWAGALVIATESRCVVPGRSGAVADDLVVGTRVSGRFGHSLIVSSRGDAATEMAWRLGEDLQRDEGGAIAVCELSDWTEYPSPIARARRVEAVLAASANRVRLGVVRPATEVLADGRHPESRARAEARSVQLLLSNEVGEAGFVAFEVDEPVERRVEWLRGVVAASNVLAPHSEGVSAALALFARPGHTGEARSAFGQNRDEILQLEPGASPLSRALYAAELAMKSMHNLEADDLLFDRDSGWWIVPETIGRAETADESDIWREALFPVTTGRWTPDPN